MVTDKLLILTGKQGNNFLVGVTGGEFTHQILATEDNWALEIDPDSALSARDIRRRALGKYIACTHKYHLSELTQALFEEVCRVEAVAISALETL